MKRELKEFADQFIFEGNFISGIPYGNGHINDTYVLVYRGKKGDQTRYILQRINHNVFKDPENLMKNIELITDHLRKKVIEDGGDPQREALTLVPAVNGSNYYKSTDGEYWRAYHFIEDAQTYEVVENLQHAYSAAQAFGKFQHQLSDFPPDKLSETIPDFHHTVKRFENFLFAVENDVVNRAISSKTEK